MLFVNLEQVGRALIIAWAAKITAGIWGVPGSGKSTKVRDLADALGYKMYDVRLSMMETSDLGGVPAPVVDTESGVRYLEYLILRGLLPFDSDEKAVLFLDEYDRATVEMQNATLQIIQERRLNQHKLGDKVVVVVAGNATTDVGTSPLTEAAATRLMHLHVTTTGPGALDSWLEWAEENDVSPLLRGFAQFRPAIFTGTEEDPRIEEMAKANFRSSTNAARVIEVAEGMPSVKSNDILPAMVAGLIGSAAATELLAFRKLYTEAPPISEILAHPESVSIPEDPGTLYALTMALSDQAKRDRDTAEAVARYGLRWPEEPAAYLFRRLLDKQPTVITTAAFQRWNTDKMGETKIPIDGLAINRDPFLAVLAGMEGKPLPDSGLWVNRMLIPSSDHTTTYTVSQDRKTMRWACSCGGWRTRRTCKHIDKLEGILQTNPVPVNS